MPKRVPDDKKPRMVNEAIAAEVRKDEGMTPTFPFGERELEAKSTGETDDASLREAREKAEIERAPGGGPKTMKPDNPSDPAPPVKEPPKDKGIGGGPLPRDDVKDKEPKLDPKEPAQTPERPSVWKDAPPGLGNLPGA